MAYELIPVAAAGISAGYDAVNNIKPPKFEGDVTERQMAASKEMADYEARLNRYSTSGPQGSVTWTEKTTPNQEYEYYKQMWKEGRLIGPDGKNLLSPSASQADFETAMQLRGVNATDSQGWSQKTTLSPEQQKIYDAQSATALGRNQIAQSMLPQARSALGKGINYNALPSAGGSLQSRDLATGLDFSGAPDLSTGDEARNRAEQSIYNRSTSRLDPQFKEQESELRTRLYNQGLREGDAAFDAEVGKFQTAKSDAYQTALDAAIQGGGAEASRTYGMDLSSRQQSVSETTNQANFMNQAAAQGLSQDQAISAYQNQLRQAALSEQQGARSQAINEMNSLQSGQQVSMPDQPQFSPSGVGSAPDYQAAAQAQYQSQLNSYNAGQAKQDNLIQGIAAAAPLLFSYGGDQKQQDPYSYGGSAGASYGSASGSLYG
jgi:hypothetical protein